MEDRKFEMPIRRVSVYAAGAFILALTALVLALISLRRVNQLGVAVAETGMVSVAKIRAELNSQEQEMLALKKQVGELQGELEAARAAPPVEPVEQ